LGLARFEQGLDALAQRRVAAAGLIEVRRALLGRQIHRRVEQGGFPLVGFARGHGMTILRLPQSEIREEKGPANLAASLAGAGSHQAQAVS